MVYVIIYDISDNKCRYKISKYLEGKGERIQESAFECRLKEVEFEKIVCKLREWINGYGNIRVYPVCENCMHKSIGIGDIKEVVGGKGYAIF